MNGKTCAPCDRNLRISKFTFDFKTLQANVRKLQMRIVKAQQMEIRNKVTALQWLRTHSFSVKILAVKRVTETKGKTLPELIRLSGKKTNKNVRL